MTILVQKAQKLVENTLDAWKELELGTIKSTADLMELIHQPEIAYNEGIRKASAPPAGLDSELAKKWKEN